MSRLGAFHRLFRYKLKNYFLTGLLVVVPVTLTIIVVRWLVNGMDGLLQSFLPETLHPERLFGVDIPGVGLVATCLTILLVGVFTANFLGRSLVDFAERIMDRIPIVKGVYHLFKQVSDTVLKRDKGAFRKVVLIEYPRREVWSIAFVTGVTQGEVQEVTTRKLVNVFVPTTPNPTSGFYLLVPEDEMIELKMSVEEAFKLVISGGMVTPPERQPKRAAGESPVIE